MRHLKQMFSTADVLLPNSQAEVDHLKDHFDISGKSIRIIPNGVDAIEPSDPQAFIQKYNLRDFILCVGRIEYRKNQHALIKALHGNDLPLVFIGAPFSPGYAELCKTLGRNRGHTHFIDHLPHAEILSACAAAKVHALPSWYETPGLVNLEAALVGANLAVSDRGSVREYFGNSAEYCQPNNLTSIRDAVERAYAKSTSASAGLREHILRNYTWNQTAERTLAAYQSAQAA